MPLLPARWRLVFVGLLLVSIPIATGVAWLGLTGTFDRVHGLVPVRPPAADNWRFLWQGVGGRPPGYVPLVNSLVFVVAVALLEVIVASMAAYAISRMSFPGRRYYLGLVLVLAYGMLNFTPMVLLPPLLQQHAGFPDALIGEVIAARGVGATIGFFLAIFIGRSGWQIAREASRVLADANVLSEEDVETVVMSVPGVLGCHHIRTRGSADHVFLDLHVWMPGFEGAKFVMSPPLREKWNQDALWKGLVKDDLQVVSTDHCPFCMKEPTPQKELGKDDFSKIPNGAPGIETRLMLLWDGGVRQGKIDPHRFVEIVSTNPAKMFGLWPKKGTIAVGSDADILVYDPNRKRTISAATHHMDVDYSLFEGWEIQGAPDLVMSRGTVLVRNNEWVGPAGHGRFVPRSRADYVRGH